MDERLNAPAAARNREPILAVLAPRLPPGTTVLEIGSGTGQHAAFFGASLAHTVWQPSDASADRFGSIRAWIAHEGASNVRPPVVLDAGATAWPVGTVGAIYNANTIHIAPWEVCTGLLRGAGVHLGDDGLLFLYGPFQIAGGHTAPTNRQFDESLRREDERFGIRDLEVVSEQAMAWGLSLEERVSMPANNFTLVFRRQPRAR